MGGQAKGGGGGVASDALSLSSDELYVGRGAAGGARGALSLGGGGASVQHSTPALELHRHWFPIAIPPNKLRQLYRTLLRKYKAGPMATQVAPALALPSASSSPERRRALVPVINLAKHIRKKVKVHSFMHSVHAYSFCTLTLSLHCVPIATREGARAVRWRRSVLPAQAGRPLRLRRRHRAGRVLRGVPASHEPARHGAQAQELLSQSTSTAYSTQYNVLVRTVV